MHSDTSRTGASFLAKRSQDNPRELIIKLIESNQQSTKDDLFALFRDYLKEEENYQRAVDWYFFVNMYEYAVTSRNRKPSASAAREAKKRTDLLVETIKTQIVLLSLTMPNGKAMRDCTGAEMAKFGNRYQRIAEKVGKTKTVGAVMSEDQVRAVLK